jgi:hypothetical protein
MTTATIDPPGTPLPVPTGAIKSASTGVVTAPPTIDQSIHVDIGSALATLFRSAEPIAEVLAGLGVTAVLSDVPFGTVIVGYATPLVQQYVQSTFGTLEKTLANLSVDVPAGNFVLEAAADMFNKNEASLAAFLGDALPAMLQHAVAALGLPLALPAPATANAPNNNKPVPHGR